MSIHLVGLNRPASVRVQPVPAFEGNCSVRGQVVDVGKELPHRLTEVRVQCQKGGPVRTGGECMMCSRFRGWHEGLGPDDVSVRCCWTETDPVWARMTAARALITVESATPCAVADELAQHHDIRHLLVVDDGAVVGLLCRCDLYPRPGNDEPVGARMSREVFGISGSANLGEAVAAMRGLGIGCLPVIADGLLIGVITRGDLRRAGIAEELLGAGRCAACGSGHGVRPDPHHGETDFCLDCLDRNDSAGEPGEVD